MMRDMEAKLKGFVKGVLDENTTEEEGRGSKMVSIFGKFKQSKTDIEMKELEKKGIIEYKPTVNFEKLGYCVRVFYLIKTNMRTRTKLKIYLKNMFNVKALYDLTSDYDFLVEIVFSSYKDVYNFEKELDNTYEIFEKKMLNVLEDVKTDVLSREKKDFEKIYEE